jgi:HlyD family secretion protein
MRRPRRTSLIRVAAALLAIAAVAWVMRPRPIVVDTVRVTRGILEAAVTAEGKTRVRHLFVITSPVDGELGRIALKAGDPVTPATVVAQLRPVASRPLDPRTRAEAEAAVTVAGAAVRRAEAAEQESVAALAHAESTSATSERLSREGVAAAKEAEHAAHELEIRRQALSGSRSAVQQARAELVRAEAAAASSTSRS